MKLNMAALTLGLFSLFVCTTSLATSAKAQDLTARVQANGNDANGRDHACSLRTLRGLYGSIATGAVVGNTTLVGPIAVLNQVNYDGAGVFTQTATITLNGNTVSGGPPERGTYTVNPDCSGSQTIFAPNGDLITSNFVIVKHGREILGIYTALGYNVTFDSKKQ
jgi:hypothetical protein